MRIVISLPSEPILPKFTQTRLVRWLFAAGLILALVGVIVLGLWHIFRPRFITATSPNQLLWTWNVTSNDGRTFRIEVRGDHIVVPIEFRDAGEKEGFRFWDAINSDGRPIEGFYLRTHPVVIDDKQGQQTCIFVPNGWSFETEWPPADKSD